MKSTEERSPNNNPRASMRIDLPEPVSPLKTLRPCLNSTCNRSITAKFTIFKSRSISYLAILFGDILFGDPAIVIDLLLAVSETRLRRKPERLYFDTYKCDKTIFQLNPVERAERE